MKSKKKTSRTKYHRKYKQERRKRFKTVSISRRKEDFEAISNIAQDYGLSEATFLFESALASINKTVLMPNREPYISLNLNFGKIIMILQNLHDDNPEREDISQLIAIVTQIEQRVFSHLQPIAQRITSTDKIAPISL